MEIVLANPRGFCAGVDRAIAIVNRALECFNPPIYVRHEVVHNKFVVDDLRQRGAVFVDELDQVPDDSIVIFSAHGVSKAVQQEADRRGLKVFDATCPLVTKVHIEVTKYAREGTEAILIGHEGILKLKAQWGNMINLVVERFIWLKMKKMLKLWWLSILIKLHLSLKRRFRLMIRLRSSMP
jgi:4-hydroxy-3-methylbut-2-enyl diphosphate reductase